MVVKTLVLARPKSSVDGIKDLLQRPTLKCVYMLAVLHHHFVKHPALKPNFPVIVMCRVLEIMVAIT